VIHNRGWLVPSLTEPTGSKPTPVQGSLAGWPVKAGDDPDGAATAPDVAGDEPSRRPEPPIGTAVQAVDNNAAASVTPASTDVEQRQRSERCDEMDMVPPEIGTTCVVLLRVRSDGDRADPSSRQSCVDAQQGKHHPPVRGSAPVENDDSSHALLSSNH
jgi:hypothetical protein